MEEGEGSSAMKGKGPMGFHKVKKIKEINYEHDSFKQGKRELAKSIVSSRVLNTKAKKLANETASAEADKAKGYVLTPCEAAIVIVQLSAEDHARKTNRESSSEADGGPIGEPSGSGSGPLKVVLKSNTKANNLANETARAEPDKAKGYVLTAHEAANIIVQLSAEDHARKTNRESSSEADGGPMGEPSGSGSGLAWIFIY
ncbi:hypothetical protein BUALT_Bualt10G0053700 [Buddleja alternifolia]|uniref:Uncharacterized protein n=1 Tax=Buddleja alternifolia TaxID=168488 RepID=A0AAV6X2V2_9LAMI|nr:hypothetical protein BUALT_Bualt10G0053700 [Buddleja alternifolia]